MSNTLKNELYKTNMKTFERKPKVEGKLNKYNITLTQIAKFRLDTVLEIGLKAINTSRVYGLDTRKLVEEVDSFKNKKMI